MPELTIKSSFFNVLLPPFLKHLFWNTIFFSALVLIYLALSRIFNLGGEFQAILWGSIFTITYSLIKISGQGFKLFYTTYSFYEQHLEIKFKFIVEKSHSVRYNKITDIKLQKSIWDRICGVGNIILYTAKDNNMDGKTHFINIRDVKNPEEYKKAIINTITSKEHKIENQHR